MAKGQSARQEALSEAEYARDMTAAVANTEAEILQEALGDGEIEGDDDTSLEEMGEGLEGDELETDEPEEGDEDEQPEGQQAQTRQGERQPERQAQPEGDEDLDEEEDEDAEPPPGERPAIPPGVLREANQRARADRERADRLERELAELRGSVQTMQQMGRQPQQQPEQEPAEPDMFIDPQGWRDWNERRTERRIETALAKERQLTDERIQAQQQDRINISFNEAAQSRRGFEFQAAYRALTSQDRRDPDARRAVARIVNSADPAEALYDWWEDNGAEEFRQQVAEQLGLIDADENPREYRQQERQQSRGATRQGRPRQTFRQPVSLNEARGGGNRMQNIDPDMSDDSESSVFSFATRR